MDPNKGGMKRSSQSGTNLPHRGPDTSHTRGQVGPAPGSLNILSSILRAPNPHLQKITHKSLESQTVLAHSQLPISSMKSQSPIRVITAIANSGEPLPSNEISLSPSRTPATLPPKKSLSPSRIIYTEARSVSPKNRASIPYQSVSSSVAANASAVGSARSTQAEILSHLPYLSQTLQGGVTPEGLFQQYKTTVDHVPGLAGLPKGTQVVKVHLGRSSPARRSPSPPQPKPAHQRSQRSPSPSGIIRRTPSPAHMPIGSQHVVRVDATPRSQAVNLVKVTQAHPAVSRGQDEVNWTETDYRYGDLLQSINKGHERIQSQLHQQNLSPITPSEPAAETKPWRPLPNVHVIPKSELPSSHPPGHVGLIGVVSNAGISGTSLGQMPSHAALTSGSNFIPISLSGTSVSATSFNKTADGYTSVSRQAQGRRTTSPKPHQARSVSPKSVHGISLSHAGSHNIPSQQPSVSFIQVPGPSNPAHETVKVFPGRDQGRMIVQTSNVSVTQTGPPNVTISSTNNTVIPQEKFSQKLPRNPFTFPATPPASLTNERPPIGGNFQIGQSKLADDKTKLRHCSDGMPKLEPVSPDGRDVKPVVKEEDQSQLVEIPQPYNMRLQTLNNFPNNSTYRPTYRATSVAIQRAKVGCITNSAKSLDILRQNLQKCINKEIDTIIQSYLEKFFKVGVDNIKLNNGENAVTDDHLHNVCRQILEEAKKMYTVDTGRASVSPARDFSDNVSETGSSGRRSAMGRKRHASDTDSEASLKPGNKKKKGRLGMNSTGRSTPSKLALQHVKREGPKFDPERLSEETEFVMGSRANKAMGFGATRGRLYMKHPELFKYNGDQDDKVWLYENQHMPATGGKTYIILLQDILELAESDEYRDAVGMSVESLRGFTVPRWMIEKMKVQMMALRTDLPKQGKYRSRSTTPCDVIYPPEVTEGEAAPKELPFSSFSSPKGASNIMETSPAEPDLEFLAGGDDNAGQLSPFNMTGGFDDTASQSDLDEENIGQSFGIR